MDLGRQSFTVPITAWTSHGVPFSFEAVYNTHSLKDPQSIETPDFSRLSQRNSRWSHTFAQWLDLFEDEAGKRYVVWHRGGDAIAFERKDVGSLKYESPENNLRLEVTNSSALGSPNFQCNGATQTLQAEFTTYRIIDADGTAYYFGHAQAGSPHFGSGRVFWQTGNCTALPHYLLAQVLDRKGHGVEVNWEMDTANNVPRVKTVAGYLGTDLTFNYRTTDGLLQNIVDNRNGGRTHTFDYTGVLDENGDTRQKLTQIVVAGPGSPRTSYTWLFAYRDDANPGAAYGGTYTGDLVIKKTLPGATPVGEREVFYKYEPVELGGRPREEDWDGRVTEISWADPEGENGQRKITRTIDVPTQQPMLIFPGNVGIRYGYTGEDVNTYALWNISRIIEAYGTPGMELQTLYYYEGTDGYWGLPTQIVNEVCGTSAFDWDNSTGLLRSEWSPANLALDDPANPDRSPSLVVTSYNVDHLPQTVDDPLGHRVTLGYAAESTGSPVLVITMTFGDGSVRTVKLDAGRVREVVDEKGVRTTWEYTPSGEVKKVTRAAGTADQRVTQFFRDIRGDVVTIWPPGGAGGAITLEYVRYDQNGMPVVPNVYESRVTRVNHPDASSETYGFYKPGGSPSAGELEWVRKPDGTIVTLHRDAQLRVRKIDYPATAFFPAFSVETFFNEFGEPSAIVDGMGQTNLLYDVLGRLTSMTPPAGAPQKGLTFSYFRDHFRQRWTTTVGVTGVGNYQFREDSKGRLFEVVNPFNQVFRQEYNLHGDPVKTIFPNGVQELRSYTPRDWLGGIQIRRADGGILDTLNYYYTDSGGAYDPTGRLRAEQSTTWGYREFGYNENLSELAFEERQGFPKVSWTYTANGTRTGRLENGVWDTYGIDPKEKIRWWNRGSTSPPTSGQAQPYGIYNYDPNGRVVYREQRLSPGGVLQKHEFRWDGADRLREVRDGNGVLLFSANYNGEGLRVSKWDYWTGTHNYTWGPGGLLYDSNQSTTITPGFAQRKNGIDRFTHEDWLGSARFLSEGTNGNSFPFAALYNAWGQRTAWGGTDPFQPIDLLWGGGFGYQAEFASATEPGLGLEYLEQRYYGPVIGRFLVHSPLTMAVCAAVSAPFILASWLHGPWRRRGRSHSGVQIAASTSAIRSSRPYGLTTPGVWPVSRVRSFWIQSRIGSHGPLIA